MTAFYRIEVIRGNSWPGGCEN